jgi:5-carboxymethyl-2-hydroxymuconate isomerase
MRFAQVDVEGRPTAAVEVDGAWRALDGGAPLTHLLADRDPRLLAADVAGPPLGGSLVAPLRPGKIVAIGLNYADHVREAGMTAPDAPLIFAKLPSSVVGPGDAIELDMKLTQRVDWEVELAAVIGRRLRRATPEEGLAGVFGYTVANDVSARDLQFGDGQWIRGKSLDTFCPLGPVVVTPDELGNPQALGLRTRVNGEVVQDSSTAEMLFGVGAILAHVSRAFTLEPGDVVLTGTPWGCGEFMQPRRALRPGDVVECEIDGIGTLRNPVVAV